MKITLSELRQVVEKAIVEAKKSKKKKVEKNPRDRVQPNGYTRSDEHDFSQPLGPDNLYRRQGGQSWGPDTSAGTHVDYHYVPPSNPLALELKEGTDVWTALHELVEPSGSESIWEDVARWYDFQGRGLGGGGGASNVAEDHIGFKKLKGQLAHRKGVTNPGGLAYSIGAKKYGKKGMAKKAAAGRK